MYSLALVTFVALTATILNCEISAETTAPPDEESIRLVNGSRTSEGRLEVFLSGEWGTVCNNLWTLTQANVVCKQLGYDDGADRVFYVGDKFGTGSGPIHLQNVQCEGTENNLFACPTSASATPCQHNEDIGIACTDTNSIRLSGDTSYGQGKLEILSDAGEWGKVCAQDWGLEETRVACTQLGHSPRPISDVSFTTDPVNGPYVGGGFNCTGDEERLDDCTQLEDWTPDSCQDGEISVTCGPDILLIPGDGLIYVWYGDDLGTICPGDNWNMNAANVACRNLGHKGVINTITVASSVVPGVILNNPVCSGEEMFYTECESAQWAYEGICISTEVDRAGVICELLEPEVKIENETPYPGIGRVEISLITKSNSFLLICAEAWNMNAADAVCRNLGYDLGAAQIFLTERLPRTDQVITRLDCPESVSNLANCTIETKDIESAEDAGCDFNRVAGVACSGGDTIVPLVGGSSTSEGVLEYKLDGLPALICDPDWSDKEAMVACRMHGYETGNRSELVSLGHTRERFPYSFQSINYTCSGDEESLEGCQAAEMVEGYVCDPDDIVQVTCQPYKDWDYRLVGSDASEQGRVEVFLGGEWASIIYHRLPYFLDHFKDQLCQKLGYKESLNDAFNSNLGAIGENPFGTGTGKVLRCGRERLFECDDDLSERAADEQSSEINVVCLPYGTVENHPIRLMSEAGVANNRTGRLEILHDGVWGSVCDNDDTYRVIPRAVCTQLGYTNSQYRHLEGEEREPFLTGNDTIWFTTDSCYDATVIYECKHGPWGQNPEDCSPSVLTCVPYDDDDDGDDDDGDAGPSLFRAHRTGLILGAVLIVLLTIKV